MPSMFSVATTAFVVVVVVVVLSLDAVNGKKPECHAPANSVSVSTTNDGLNLEGIQCNSETVLQPTATDGSNDWGYECVEQDDDVWIWKPTSGYRTEHVQPCCLPMSMSACTFARARNESNYFSYNPSQSVPPTGESVPPVTFQPSNPEVNDCDEHSFLMIYYECMEKTVLKGTGENSGVFYCYGGAYYQVNGQSMNGGASSRLLCQRA